MSNVIPEKRGMLILLVIATVVIFVGTVWAIVAYLPINQTGKVSPTQTISVVSAGNNCTRPVSYWKEHAELYPPQVVVGGQVYKANNLGSVFSSDTDDERDILQSELTAAYLNIYWGAEQSYIETILFEGYSWLVDHQAGSELSDSDLENATRLYNLLEAYNNGMTGVEACEANLAGSWTSTVTLTPTPMPSHTPSQTTTAMASETPTPTQSTPTATYVYIPPTNTDVPITTQPAQHPTNTKVPPTNTLAPTNTQPPPATSTNPPNKPPTLTPPPTEVPTITPAP